MRKSIFSLGLVAAVALGCCLTACGGTTEADKELIAQLTITHAVDKVIEGGEDPVVRAARVYDIAVTARSLLSKEVVSLPLLEQVVQAELSKQALTPADAKLVSALVRAISVDLARRVGSNHLDAEQKLAVDKVLGWVIDAATLTKPVSGNFTVELETQYAQVGYTFII